MSTPSSERLAEDLQEKAATLQGALARIVVLAAAVQAADQAFCESLPLYNDPSGFVRREFTATLFRRMEFVLYALSDGSMRPLRVFESPFQVRQQGRADLKRAAGEYATVAMRGRQPFQFDDDPPEAA